jgi:flagellar basal body-associated protein FliL
MAVFHQSDAVSVGNKKKISPVVILLIVLSVLLCCCCVAVIIVLIATGGKPGEKIQDLLNKDSYLPLYLTLRTWL